MRELDGIRISGPEDGTIRPGRGSTVREIVSAEDTAGRWRFGEVTAEADPHDTIGTHLHPGEPEVIVILEGAVELLGAQGSTMVRAGEVLFIPPDTEHGLRTPEGGRWLAIWPMRDRVPGPRSSA